MSTSDFLLLVILVAAAASSWFTSVGLVDACVPKEKEALLEFKKAITIDHDRMLEAWQPDEEDDCCQWDYVHCSNLTGGHVVELHLGDSRGSGGLTGEISPSLLSLQHLEFLDLSGNSLQGRTGKIPEFLGSLQSLRYLDLSFVPFSGSVPPQLGNLSKLEELHLLDAGVQMHSTDLWWLTHLPLLWNLDLGSNNITGPFPAFMGNLTNLRTLNLGVNHLSGHLPSEISRLAKLTSLDLTQNYFDGLITEEHLDGLESLDYIDLSYTNLKIMVYSKWTPTFRLHEAYFSGCEIGPLFPAWLKLQVNLHRLDISNASINDRLPDWFSNTFSKVTYLDISNNQISGGLPKNMDIMSLEALYSSSNNLTGQIPPLPRSLNFMDISKNSLSGPLPTKFGAPNLDTIILYSNYLSGQVPTSICELSLWGLDLANNLFEGEFPQCLNMTQMAYLLLGNNSFSGSFPPFIRRCTNLSFLILAWNRFTGTVPEWIGSCRSLQFLRLNHNMFHGNIPNNITSLTKLYHLNLADNWISGAIPQHLSNLTSLTRTFALDPYTVPAGFQNTVGDLSIDIKRQKLNYHGAVILELLSIDLSSNYLRGKIPEEMTSLGGLVNLNLSHNQLDGEISDQIGAMLWLESLDLSSNHLSGEIPSSISILAHLSVLDLSNNNLSGRIPSGGQLDTLYSYMPSMYDGNKGLCGPPLQQTCPSNNIPVHGDDEHYSKSMSFGLGIGYVVGLWVVFVTLLFQKTRRIAYFLLLDKFYDKIYVFVAVTCRLFTRKADTS
ncbi:receptor-like protein EIX2 [Miscanthus floridulus]|uniref:receptor-like protein EIX2 n=1 Tax=Miscanthus floridulus TaxID=154761 RepID=UPI003457F7B6